MGVIGLIIILRCALALYLAVRWWQRAMFIRQLRMDRITVDELVTLLDNESRPLVLDVRSRAARADGVIPGAIPAHPDRDASDLGGLRPQCRDRGLLRLPQ